MVLQSSTAISEMYLAKATRFFIRRGLPVKGIEFVKQIGVLVEVLQIADRASRSAAADHAVVGGESRLGSRPTWPISNNPAPTAINTAAATATTGRRSQASQLRAGAADSSRKRARNRELK